MEKYRPEKTSYLDTMHAVKQLPKWLYFTLDMGKHGAGKISNGNILTLS